MMAGRWRQKVAAMDLLVLLLLAVAAAPSSTTLSSLSEDQQHYLDLSFDLVSRPYIELYPTLYDVLADNKPRMAFAGATALSPRYTIWPLVAPARWIRLRLLGEGGEGATVLMSNEDLNIAAFSNMVGDWYYFDDWASAFSPPAMPLPFRMSYTALLGDGGSRNLVRVPLGRSAMLRAVRTLSRFYDPSPAAEGVEDAKLAVAQLMVMLSEALRFRSVREAFAGAGRWENETFLTEVQAATTIHWGRISYCLLAWNSYGQLPPRCTFSDISVNNPLDALAIVDFLIRNV